jgi:hypothetical protein
VQLHRAPLLLTATQIIHDSVQMLLRKKHQRPNSVGNMGGRSRPSPITSVIFLARAWPPKQLNLAAAKQPRR